MRFFMFVAVLLVCAGVAVGSVRRMSDVPPDGPYVVGESAALFVGVRDFRYDDDLTEVRYAVDDAVELAYAMAIELRPPLVEPHRVVLALSGAPSKSKEKLDALLAAGAQQRTAGQADILTLLRQQAAAVGPNGALFVSFATHGIHRGGTQYLFSEGSLLWNPEATAVSEADVRDMIARARVPRALLLIDACRGWLTKDSRNGDPDPRSAAAMLQAIGSVHGLIVLSAAAPGGYAYDDDSLRNGVFTAAVIDGLRCQARRDERGWITVDALAEYVEERVLAWVRKQKGSGARVATQLQSEGRTRTMPLAMCGQ